MKIDRFSEPQILGILKPADSGVPVLELCREHGMSSASFYKWRAKYGGMDASMITQMKAMDDENRRLKKMFAKLSMQNELLKRRVEKNRSAISTTGDGRKSSRRSRCFYHTGLSHFWA
jgi:putative transposase